MMEANKKLNKIKEMLKNDLIEWDKNEHIADVADRIKETKNRYLDEIGLIDGEEIIKTTLDMYLSDFYTLLIDDICNVIDTFIYEETEV